jgi:DNA polymerase III epsilon subunit family exonuclease
MNKKARIAIAVLFLAGSLSAKIPSSSTLVANVVFVAFDTETTGFSPKNQRLVEIGAVKFRGNGEILAEKNWLVNPEMSIPPAATRIHEITDQMVKDAPLFKEICSEFEEFCKNAVLLAHNAPFDINFVRAEMERAGIDAPAFPVLDTLPLFRAWFPDATSHSLDKLSAYLGVHRGIYHRADADSYHIIDVMRVGMKSRPAIQLRQMEREAGGFEWLDGKTHNADGPLEK